MKILTIDIGTGTQDIYLYDSRLDIENGYRFVLPSPTMQVRKVIKQAIVNQSDIVLCGYLMGGGPNTWAVEEALRSGLQVYATEEAARTLDDDLQIITQMGIKLISEDELKALPEKVKRIWLHEFDFGRLQKAFSLLGITMVDLALVSVAVFDHGQAPKGMSDRKFRFEFLESRMREKKRLNAFAWRADQLPMHLTRMRSVVAAAGELLCPLMLMDTAPAAILGAALDPAFQLHERNLVVNIGNGHTLACRFGKEGVEGLLEHHTGCLNPQKLDELLLEFAKGSLTNEGVFADHGHGALTLSKLPLPMDHADFNFLVTGPRQNMVKASNLKPRFAAPFGDMMLTGCFGQLAAAAELYPNLQEPIRESLASRAGENRAPWDLVD